MTNTGSSSLSVTSIAASGDFAQTNTCGSTVAAGASCTISVTFTPTAAGVRDGAITITDDAAGSPQTVSLTGTGIVSGVSVTLSTSSLTFPDQVVQTTSAPQAITLTNTGTATLIITAIVASGDFAQTNTCGNSLASGANCTVSVTFTPTQAGTRTGNVTITDNALDSPQSVLLTGQGVTAQSYDVAADFERGWASHSNPNGVWSYGYSSGFAGPITLYDQTVQPGLDGVGQLWLSSSVDIGYSPGAFFNDGPAFDDGNINFLADEFVLVAGIGGQYSDLVFTVPADGVYSIASEFRGAQYAIGTVVGVVENGNLLFSSSVTSVGQLVPFNTTVSLKAGNTLVFSVGPGGGSQNTGLSLTITGPSAAATLSPASLSFGPQLVSTTSDPQAVTLTNTGTGPLTITSIGSTGDFAQSNSCGDSVALGAGCTISVTFTPTALGTRTGTITINDDASGSPEVVELSGVGSEVGVSPASLTFKSQNVGTASPGQVVTLTNHGSAAVSLTGVTTTGDFEVTAPCPSIPPQGSCKILVIFRPTQTGSRTGVLTINDSEPSQATVALSGTGTAPSVSLSAGTFAGQVVTTSSAAQSVTLTNTGSGPLTITGVTTSGDYAATAGHCAGTVAAGASCEIAVLFKPLLAGNRTGSLSIADTATGSPQTVALSGTGEDFTLSARTMSATVTAGQTASYTLSLASEDGFSGTVVLTCTGVPATAACSLSPSAVTLAASDATLVTVGVTTTARSMAPPASRHWLQGPASPQVWLLFTLLLAFAMSVWTWRRSVAPRRALLWVPLGAALLLVALWAGCGSSGGGTTVQPRVTGTPAGTYELTVAATDSGLTTNVALTLVVN